MATTVDTARLQELGLAKQSPKVNAKADLGQDQFLQLMTTQLQNQDPMKPMENGEFLGQIAQFASVRGIQDLQKTFGDLAGSLQSNQAFQAAGLVGKEVLVANSSGVFNYQGLPVRGAVELSSGADQVEVAVIGANGQTLRTLDLGSKRAGLSAFTWDGRDATGAVVPDGAYQIKAVARVAGKSIASDTLFNAKVDSVSFGKNQEGLTLNLAGVGPRDFKDVREIR
jgi:flagellar basal-body rod modification protein FlgD